MFKNYCQKKYSTNFYAPRDEGTEGVTLSGYRVCRLIFETLPHQCRFFFIFRIQNEMRQVCPAMIFPNSPPIATFLESDTMFAIIILCVVFTADRITTGITKNPESKN
jgi:hypothetical protein